jgi:hypothetical protein
VKKKKKKKKKNPYDPLFVEPIFDPRLLNDLVMIN